MWNNDDGKMIFLFYYDKSSELSFLIKKMSWLCWETSAEIQHSGDIRLLFAFWWKWQDCQTGKLKCLGMFTALWSFNHECSIKKLSSYALCITQTPVLLYYVFKCKSQNTSDEISAHFLFSTFLCGKTSRSKQTVVVHTIDSFEVERAFQVSIKVSEAFSLQPT